MKFFFPDSQDQIDPGFDFISEQRSPHRIRQRDDLYAHEVFIDCPYDGLLVSKAIVDGLPGSSGKYTAAQRNRLYRQGAQVFFRLNQPSHNLGIMGDCGAFTYVREDEPVYTIDEVIDFYEGCSLDYGLAMDHVVFGYDASLDQNPTAIPAEWIRRQDLTLSLAQEFLERCGQRRTSFVPYGIAHGWSPGSYRHAVAELQRIGFDKIALGGMVPLKTTDILDSLQELQQVLHADSQLHMLGVTRTSYLKEFAAFGVTSFDSTSPFRQSFKDDRDNYHTVDRNYVAIRVPQVDGNTQVRKLVAAGAIDQREARRYEAACLRDLRRLGEGTCSSEKVLDSLRRYSKLIGDSSDRSDQYLETLRARPWESCGCEICKTLGIEVIIFRGAERNRRRGYHNLRVFANRLAYGLSREESEDGESGGPVA